MFFVFGLNEMNVAGVVIVNECMCTPVFVCAGVWMSQVESSLENLYILNAKSIIINENICCSTFFSSFSLRSLGSALSERNRMKY